VACVASEPKSPDPVRLVFALVSQAAHAQRLPGDRPVPVLAAGTSDNVPVLVLVAALLARDQKPRHWSNINNGPGGSCALVKDRLPRQHILSAVERNRMVFFNELRRTVLLYQQIIYVAEQVPLHVLASNQMNSHHDHSDDIIVISVMGQYRAGEHQSPNPLQRGSPNSVFH
jgi:hypothetical protein